MINSILLRRKNKIWIMNDQVYNNPNSNNIQLIATGLTNLSNLGYTLSNEVIEKLLESTYVESFFVELIDQIKKFVGADVVYNPMYPNFPTQVMEMSEGELYLNAIVHYWSYGTFYPVTEKVEERPPLFDISKIKVLTLGTEEDYHQIFKNLMSSKTSISEQDKDDLEVFFATNSAKVITSVIPEDIPFKENMAVIVKLLFNTCVSMPEIPFIKTATDVLRIITAMSNGDVSLASNTKFKSLKRRERRFFLDVLDNMKDTLRDEDMYRHKNKWLRVGEILHPREYSNSYPNVANSFSKLRNNVKIPTFNGKAQELWLKKDINNLVKHLMSRPAELARRLDSLLSYNINNPNLIVRAFKECAKDVSNNVLWQVLTHFQYRTTSELRTFFPKGNVAKCYAIENNQKPIQNVYCKEIVCICEEALINNYSSKDNMGNIYIDPTLKEYFVPYSQRSASKSLRTITRGSKLSLSSEVKIIRPFIWWTNQDNKRNDDWYSDSRVDIDLSAAIFDENWKYLQHVSYTNLKSDKFKMYHSGDITNGGPANGQGVAEFIDMDIDSVANNGGRYIICQVQSFTNIPYNELENCRFGWMERSDINSGEIFEPKTVVQKMDLTTDTRTCIPVIIDCVNREIIWADLAKDLNNFGRHANAIENHLSGSSIIAYALTNMHKPTIYDLVYLNALARGSMVNNIDEADYIFCVDNTMEYTELVESRKVQKTEQEDLIKKFVEEHGEEVEIPEELKTEIHIPKIITAFDTDVYSEMI